MDKKRTLTFFVLFLVFASLLLPALPAAADEDSVEVFAREFLQAIQDQKTSAEITIEGITDFESLLNGVFSRYPVLYHYYDGAQWVTRSTELVATCQLKNVSDPVESLFVIRSEDELMAVLGLGLAQPADSISFVCADGFLPDSELISDLFERLRHEYYLSYMGYHGYSYTYTVSDNGISDFLLTYRYFYDLPTQTIAQWRTQTEAVAIELAGTLFAEDMPDYERVLKIHDWIINNTRYNSGNMDEPGNHLAYGAMVKGSCVCQGYAEAFLLLAKTAGLETVCVRGQATNSSGIPENHAWNAVKVQGEWYMIDTTWDDPISSDNTDILRYDYFLLSSRELAVNHDWVQSDYPACSSDLIDYDWVLARTSQNQTVYQQYNPDSVLTQAESVAAFYGKLSAPLLPDLTVPKDTKEPDAPTVPATVPAIVVPNHTPGTNPVKNTASEQSRTGVWVWIAVILILLACAGGAAYVAISNQSRRKAYSRPYAGHVSAFTGKRRSTPGRSTHKKVQW